MGIEEIRILAIEDELDIRTLILHNLKKDGYVAIGARTGEEGLRLAVTHKPHLILLDLMLPGMDGMAVCRKLRADAQLASIPVLMLTARNDEEATVFGLESGADDYLAKPFSNRLLLAHIRALLRRTEARVEEQRHEAELIVGEIRLVPRRMEVTVDGRRTDLTSGEYRMLQAMMRRPGIVFTRNQLIDLVHGTMHAVTDRAVDVQVVGLRRKLGRAGARIETVRGAGYRVSSE